MRDQVEVKMEHSDMYMTVMTAYHAISQRIVGCDITFRDENAEWPLQLLSTFDWSCAVGDIFYVSYHFLRFTLQ